MPKKLICVFGVYPCPNPRRYVLCRIASKFLPLNEFIDAVGKAIYTATTGNLPEGIRFEDLPEEVKQFVRRKKDAHYRV